MPLSVCLYLTSGVCTLEALQQVVKGVAERAVGVRVEVVAASVGDLHQSDVELVASGGHALVLAFNVGIADAATRAKAKQLDVSVSREVVIYRLEDELVRIMGDQLPKERVLKKEVMNWLIWATSLVLLL